MDEENTVPAENVEAVEDNSQDTSPVDETNTSESTETDESPSAEETSEETQVEPERKPTRAERRIRQLAQENQQLRSQPNQLPPSFQQPPANFDVRQYADEEGNLDVDAANQALSQSVAQAAQSVVNPQLQQLRNEFETKEALRNFDSDLAVIETKYPELAEDSPIAEVLENQITEEYKQKAYRLEGFNPYTGEPVYRIDPSVRLSDIAASKVADARAIAEKASADMKNSVARTADNTAIRPNGVSAPEKSLADMSIAEMEAKFGIVRQ